MADYYPLIARAVEALDKNTGENRRALYERARTALVAQLRGVVPALEEAEITRERLALEEAIRKIEAESARRAREETRAPPPARRPEPAPHRDGPVVQTVPPAAAEPPPPPRDVPPEERRSLSEEALRGFRDTVSDIERHPPAARRAEARPSAARPAPAERRIDAPPPAPRHALEEYGQLEPQLETENLWDSSVESRPPGAAAARAETRGAATGRPKPPQPTVFDDAEVPRPRRARAFGLKHILLALALIAIGAIAAIAWWQRDVIGGVAGSLVAWMSAPSKPVTPPDRPTQPQPKISDRIGPAPTPQPGAPVAQRVVLYEEDPDDPQGKRLVGSVIWSTEVVPPAPGRQPEMAVRARIEVPERKMTVTWSLRRNSDPSLPASHTIEVMFNLPPDAPSGGVQNVPGVLMKQAEQTRGVPLAGLAVKVTPGYFLIGLSSLESDMQRNIQLLKERSWFDIPIVYNNNRRAILAMEKGTPGEKAFNDAFATWKQ
jgi:hypothetical protein